MTYFRTHQDTEAHGGAPTCAIIVEANLRIVAMSGAAKGLLESDGRICVRFGRLDMARPRDLERLRQAVMQIQKNRSECANFTIDGVENPLSLSCQALHNGGEAAAILILIQEANLMNGPNLYDVTSTYGLTPSESRLLAILCQGLNVPQAAAKLDVAYSTARSHLQHVFDKTGVRRQADLMRLVGPMALN
ncbi:MAG: hypothetical protein RL186_569 [Pseudomonadota bacterium]